MKVINKDINKPTDQVLYAAIITCIILAVALLDNMAAYTLITFFFLPLVVFQDIIGQPDPIGQAGSGVRKWIYPLFGLAYSAFLGIHIFTLGRQTLAKASPLDADDPAEYITFVATFAWAFLLLTYRPARIGTQKQE